MKNKNIIRARLSVRQVALITGLILLIPLALQFTIGTGVDGQGFNWKLSDFIVMGILLFGTGLAIDFAARTYTNSTYGRFIAIFVIIVVFLLIWAELAIGIFGTPFAGS